MNDERAKARAREAPPEETGPGTDAPEEQAAAILEDSDLRQDDRNASPGGTLEHRHSEDTVDPPTTD